MSKFHALSFCAFCVTFPFSLDVAMGRSASPDMLHIIPADEEEGSHSGTVLQCVGVCALLELQNFTISYVLCSNVLSRT